MMSRIDTHTDRAIRETMKEAANEDNTQSTSPENDVRGNLAVYIGKLKEQMDETQAIRLDKAVDDLEKSIESGAEARITKFTETIIGSKQRNLERIINDAGIGSAAEKTAIIRQYLETLHNYTKPKGTIEGFQFREDIIRQREKEKAENKGDSGAKIG
ncbi:MAG: hypothetical protein ACN2B6_02835 [Rickettsiales bacterium]